MEISQYNDKQFAYVFTKLLEIIKEDPINNFIKASGFMDFIPSAVQEVILKVIFNKPLDGTQLKEVRVETKNNDLPFDIKTEYLTEIEIYERLAERKYIPFDERSDDEESYINKVNLVCGRRGGKTTIAAIIAIYYAISTNWKPFLKKTPYATVLILSHTTDFSDEIIELVRSLIEGSPVLSRLINKEKKNTASAINLKIPFINDGKIVYSRVQIRTNAASSKSTRGVAAAVVLLDEIAFWNLDEKMKETDTKILKAVRPAMKQFGKHGMLIKLSSPGIKQGVLYGESVKWKEGTLPPSYAVFKASSWELNNIVPKEEFIEEFQLDPDGFDVEYRGNFSDSISNFISPEFIDLSIIKGTKFLLPEDRENVKLKAAIDAAYKGDHFTFSVVGYVGNRVKQFVSKGWQGSRKNPVSAYEVAEYIKTVCKQYDIQEVSADQFSFQPLREIFLQFNLTLTERVFTPMFKKKIYFNLKKLIHTQQIDLLDHEIQTKELKELIVEQAGTGIVRIHHPTSGSDDYADSLAIAAFEATEDIGNFDHMFDSALPTNTAGVKVDRLGTAFTAPSPEMLSHSGHLAANIIDNSNQYTIDPKTGKLVKIDDLEDEGGSDGGPDFIF